jgi:hypothetical protein
MKGDTWYFTVRPNDGKEFGTVRTSPSVVIQNSPPTIDSFTPEDAMLEINEGEDIEFTHTSFDLDNDTLTYLWLLDGIEQSTTQNWTYTANYTSAGTHNITTFVSDGELEVSKQWTVAVSNVDQPPVIDISFPLTDPTINEGESQEFSITYSDLDGDNIAIQWYLNDTSTVTTEFYIFDADYSSAGTYNVTVVISDGTEEASHEWRLTVINVNRAPTIDSFTPTETMLEVNQNDIIEFTHTSSDPDNDLLTYSWLLDGVEQWTGQNWTCQATTPGTFNITLVVSDGELLARQQWNVAVNAPPNITSYYPSDDPTIFEGQSQEFNVTYFDPDGDTLTIQWYVNGSLVEPSPGDSYTYEADVAGIYIITVIVSDGLAQTSHQ